MDCHVEDTVYAFLLVVARPCLLPPTHQHMFRRSLDLSLSDGTLDRRETIVMWDLHRVPGDLDGLYTRSSFSRSVDAYDKSVFHDALSNSDSLDLCKITKICQTQLPQKLTP